MGWGRVGWDDGVGVWAGSSITGQYDKKDALFVFGSAATVCTVQITGNFILFSCTRVVNHVFPVLSACRGRGGSWPGRFTGTQWSLEEDVGQGGAWAVRNGSGFFSLSAASS